MASIYQLWSHRDHDAVYVVRLVPRHVGKTNYHPTGVCGPFAALEVARDTDWSRLGYETGPALEELLARRGEFTVHALAAPGREQPRPGKASPDE
jgi:hypothetical protein